MQRQLDVVTKMMVHLLDQKNTGSTKEDSMEVVKPGVQQLPLLLEPGDTAPIDLGDWLTTVEPVMADLSDGSHVWWAQVVHEATCWYKDYVKLRPIQRTNFEANPSDELKKEKWVRVERRAGGVKEELVATKSLTPLRILAKLMSLYQPGGLQEKTVILKQLEDPGEATSAALGVQQLRKWLRWLRRAEDVGLSLPDASILVRGLHKLMKKVLGAHPEMAFRASLIRNTLQLDTIPNHDTVKTFSEHLLGEMEQLVHLEKKTKQRAVSPQVRQMDAEKPTGGAAGGFPGGGGQGLHRGGQGSGGQPGPSSATAGQGEQERQKPLCKFFLTESGCRKGKACKFSHDQKDGKRRCFGCGSTQHMAGACPNSKEGGAKVKKVQLDDGVSASPTSSSGTPTSAATGSPADDSQGGMMKELLGEANKMLRGLGGHHGGAFPGGTEDKSAKVKDTRMRLEELQAELRQLQRDAGTSLRVLRIARVKVSDRGLLDTGATHAMRGIPMGFDVRDNEKVSVSLAGGGETAMWLTAKGTLIHPDEEVEPIVPVGKLVRELGCKFQWDGDDCTLEHPLRGRIEVAVVNACPEVSREDALKLIEDLECPKDPAAIAEALGTKRKAELMFLDRIITDHPAFETVPMYLKDKVVDLPATTWEGLGLNRRLRKRIKNQGCIIHLYAGDEGFTLTKAMKECGGDTTRLLEFDLLRDPDHCMLRKGGLYATLLRMALDGCIDGVLGGPNGRTRSVLRHTVRPGYPNPSRSVATPLGLPVPVRRGAEEGE